MKSTTLTKPSSLSTQLTSRVLLLSLIGVTGLAGAIILSLLLTLQQVQNRIDKINFAAVREFDLFFLDIQSDLLATGESLAARNDVDLALLHIQARNVSFLDVLLVNLDGTILAQRNAVGRPGRARIAEPSWLESPPLFGEVYIGAVGFEDLAPFVDIAVRATDDIGLPAGLLWVRVDLTELWNTTLDIQVGQRGYAYIADDNGQLVAYRNRRLLENGSNLAHLVGRTPQAIAKPGLSLYTGLNDQLVLASAHPLEAVPWFAIVEQPVAEALAPFLLPAAMLLLVLVSTGLLLYSIIKFTRSRIVSPLLELSSVVGQMTQGRLNQRVAVRHDDELGQLAHSFNTMVRQLNTELAERKQAEEETRRAQTFLNTIVENIPNMIFVKDALELRFVLFNKAGEELIGYSREEMLGKNDHDFFPKEEADFFTTKDREVLKNKRRVDIAEESIQTRYKGSRLLHTKKVPMLEADGEPQYLLGISEDITESKQAEEELRTYRDHLQELVEARTAELAQANQKLEKEITERVLAEEELRKAKQVAERARTAAEAASLAKSAFLANVSHELRTPLNAILGFTQLMRRDPAIPPTQRENLRIIYQSGEHLLELLNDVLEMSKIEAGRATFVESDFDLYRLLDGLESMFNAHAQDKGLQLCFERAPGVPQYLHTDERKLRQTLINLLSNAVKFTEQGGVTLRVTVDRDRGTSNSLSLSPVSICFEVHDTGAGIAPEEQGKIFEAFTQTASGQEAQEGTGLGLALSRRFVQLMGGDIAVQSPLPTGESGSLFRFDIRVSVADVGAVQEQRPARRVVGLAPGQRAYRILVAEDREASRALLVQLLAAVGFQVREAANGQEALKVWDAWHPHLIWMDVRMPVLDGYEATQRIKTQPQIADRQPPIIIALTAHAFEEERAAILTAGCDDFVRKPFRETEIFDKMAEYLGVQYIYEELDQLAGAPVPPALKPADLAALPSAWVADLRQAAMAGEAGQIFALLEQITAEHTPLTRALAQLVHEFRFDKLVALAQSDGPINPSGG